jgi:hypothetical protein
MSRVLRRPMFRGGIADSDGVGITSGLDTPKRGLVDGPGGYAGELSFGERFRMAMEQDNANKQAKYDALKSDKSYDLANLFKSNSDQKDSTGFDYLRDTGLGRFAPKFNEYAVKEPLAALYNLIGVPINKATEFVTGYNPGFSGERFFNLDMKNRKPDTAEFFGIDTSAQPGMTYKNEQKKLAEAKAAIEKANAEKISLYTEPKEDVTQTAKLPTLEEDIDLYNKLLLDRAGPDKDEYTRQKYLTLAKFGLNLLKPTPAGVKSNLLSNVASAAEKPLEEYGNISMQQSKEDRALRQLATQMAFQKNIPGNIAKGIQDLMRVNPNMTVEEATTIVTTGKNKATLEKEERLAIDATRSRLETNPNLKGLIEKDPATLNLLAKIVEIGNVDDTQIKGSIGKYNFPTENSYYTDVPNPRTNEKEVAHYYKGKFHFKGEPNFIVKNKGI